MNTLLIYMVKVAVYLMGFYLVYSIMLSKDTSYSRNRTFILLSLASSIILPSFTFQTIKPMDIQYFGKLLSEVFITATSGGAGTETAGSAALNTLQIIYSVYFIGLIAFIFKLIIDLLNLMFLIARQKNKGSRIIRFHGFNTAGFSAMGYIFINTRLSPEEAGEIIKHEQNHLKKNHFIDIIFIETIKAFQWFNPVVYLFNRSLRAIHEYQADEGCLSSGVPMVNYQSLLLSQVFKSSALHLTNSFSNPSLIKKRMIMMTKKRTSAFANIKLFLVIPVISLVFLAISACAEKSNLSQDQVEIIPLPVSAQPDSKTESMLSASTSETSSVSFKNIIAIPHSSLSDSRSETMLLPPMMPVPKSVEVKEGEKETDVETEIFTIVEEMPEYPGGIEELLKYIYANTQYPEVAKVNNIQGRVVVRFCVTATGGISQVSIFKGVDPQLDAEAMRVVKTIKAFRPGKQGGKPVPVWFIIPINYVLK